MIRKGRIRELRDARGLSQPQLAKRLRDLCGEGSPAQIRRWESGEKQPSLIAARTLAKVLGVSFGSILEPDFLPPKPTTEGETAIERKTKAGAF